MASILDELKNKYPESEDIGKANNIAEGVAAIPVSEPVEVPEEATPVECYSGTAHDKYISPYVQHRAAMHGLAKAAAEVAKGSVAFSGYTDTEKANIKAMIGVDETPDWQMVIEISESSGTYSAGATFDAIMSAVNAGKVITAKCNGQLSTAYLVNLQATIPVIYFTFVETDATATNLNVYRIAVYASDTVEKEATKHVELTA